MTPSQSRWRSTSTYQTPASCSSRSRAASPRHQRSVAAPAALQPSVMAKSYKRHLRQAVHLTLPVAIRMTACRVHPMSLVSATWHGCKGLLPSPQVHAVPWRGMDSLQQLLTCSGQLGSTLYYRLLDMPLAEWESMKTVKARPSCAGCAREFALQSSAAHYNV